MSIGQLYIVSTRSTTAAGEKIKERWLVNGANPDDVVMKLRYRIDISALKSFSVTGIDKVKPGIQLISRVVTSIDDSPKLLSPEGTAHAQRTNQPANHEEARGGTFAVGFAGSVGAVDAMHAIRLVAQFLIDHSMGRENHRVRDDRVVMVEQLGETDSTAVSKCENPYTVTRVFRGGAVGSGRR